LYDNVIRALLKEEAYQNNKSEGEEVGCYLGDVERIPTAS